MTDTNVKRILVVEDDSEIQRIVNLALRFLGKFEVCLCSSGEEAILQVDSFSPEIILLDVMMPGMDGLQTLRALQRQQSLVGVAVVFMTARVQTHEVLAYREAGAVDVIHKPFDPVWLVDYLKQLGSA